MNETRHQAAAGRGGGLIATALSWLERIPYSLIALIARGAAFEVFWRSGSVKLADWAGTLSLFESEYKVPLVPPHIAAYMAAGLELGGAGLTLAGPRTRRVALAFPGLTTVPPIFGYPDDSP